MTAAALDVVALATLPTAPVFHATENPPLAPGERRLLVARDGAYLEARSDALHVCLRIAAFRTPYAAQDEFVRCVHGPIPRHVWAGLCEAALAASPTEMARLVVATEGGYTLVEPPVSSAGSGHVTFDESLIEEGSLVIDAHSHGNGRAFFSGQDDQSDLTRTGPHISVVFGRCGAADRLELAARVCVPPYLLPINFALLAGD